MKEAGEFFLEFIWQETKHYGELLMTSNSLIHLVFVQPQGLQKFISGFML